MSDDKKAVTGKRVWEAPTLQAMGKVADTIRGGGGKLSPMTNDTGDDRKPKGAGA